MTHDTIAAVLETVPTRALAALEAATDDKTEAEAVEADTREILLGLCVELVREHAEPDARLV